MNFLDEKKESLCYVESMEFNLHVCKILKRAHPKTLELFHKKIIMKLSLLLLLKQIKKEKEIG